MTKKAASTAVVKVKSHTRAAPQAQPTTSMIAKASMKGSHMSASMQSLKTKNSTMVTQTITTTTFK